MLPPHLKSLIEKLSSLPDTGPRAATRTALFLLSKPEQELRELAGLISGLKTNIKTCPDCFNLSDGNSCAICRDSRRDKSVICVIENILNLIPLEKTGRYNGLYHVLGGLISPMDKISPENIRIEELVRRVKKSAGETREVILALNPTVEGDTTALYIERELSPFKIKITRLARGLSTGNSLEYADEITLSNALTGRK